MIALLQTSQKVFLGSAGEAAGIQRVSNFRKGDVIDDVISTWWLQCQFSWR